MEVCEMLVGFVLRWEVWFSQSRKMDAVRWSGSYKVKIRFFGNGWIRYSVGF